MAPRGGVKLAGPGPNQIEADSSAKPRLRYCEYVWLHLHLPLPCLSTLIRFAVYHRDPSSSSPPFLQAKASLSLLSPLDKNVMRSLVASI